MNFTLFDSDNHYYESRDAFTRHASKRMRREQTVRWLAEEDGRRLRLIINNQVVSMIGNPTFDPIGEPGAWHKALIDLERRGASRDELHSSGAPVDMMKALSGTLRPIDDSYRDRAARLRVMDDQRVERVLLFPTLGVVVEGCVSDDLELLYDLFHGFNEWLDEDWGYDRDDRMYAVPHIVMADVDRSVAELETVLQRGAKVVHMRAGACHGRSPADPYFDPVWARLNEANVAVTYHTSTDPADQYTRVARQMWSATLAEHPREATVLASATTGDRRIMDTLSALVLHNLFGRFPNLRVGCIELGASWVSYLMHTLDHAGGLMARRVDCFGATGLDRPSETFRQHVWVSPFPEEDLEQLARDIGPNRILMGSDWPHLEGIPEPADYATLLKSFDDHDVRRIMRDNAFEFVGVPSATGEAAR